MSDEQRIVCRFSCGAASAVATKLALSEYPRDRIVIINAFVQEEHEDNRRFLLDCERWFEHPITVLRDEKYGASTHEVWKQRRYMLGRGQSPCSTLLKGVLLDAFCKPGDLAILGYTIEEQRRLELFFDRRADLLPRAPLIERGLTKSDCLAIIDRAGIELPVMYRLGYHNANCIGCVKGGEGYWNKIRRDFPIQFNKIADIQDSIGSGAYLFRNRKTGVRYSLRQLPPNAGRYPDEPNIECGFSCEIAEQDLKETQAKTEAGDE